MKERMITVYFGVKGNDLDNTIDNLKEALKGLDETNITSWEIDVVQAVADEEEDEEC